MTRRRHVAALAAAALTLSACATTEETSSTQEASATESTSAGTNEERDEADSSGSSGSAGSSGSGRSSDGSSGSAGSSGDRGDPVGQESTGTSPDDGQGTSSHDGQEQQADPSSDAAADRKLHDVVRVVDGDTVEVDINGGESIRVIGIDTPETVHPNEPTECGGQAASETAKSLLEGKQVAVVFDPTQGRRDTYGRMLAYLDIPGSGDFGEIMLRKGHAAEYTYDTAYRRQSEYRAAEQEARSKNRTLWATCGGPDTPVESPEPTPTETRASAPAPAPSATPAPPAESAPTPGGNTGGGAAPNPAGKANAPGPGWTNDSLRPGYSGCRQGYPGGKINGVYWWKPISC